MEKFQGAIDWDNLVSLDDVTDQDVAKAEFKRMIEKGTFDLKVTAAELVQVEGTEDKDLQFWFKVTVENEAGETRTNQYKYCPLTWKQGDKGSMFWSIQLRKLLYAVGIEEFSLQDQRASDAVRKKYLRPDKMQHWVGLKYRGTYAYKTGDYHMQKTEGEEPYALYDSEGALAIFPKQQIVDESGELVTIENQPIRGATSDVVKGRAGMNGIKPRMSEQSRLVAIDGVNTEALAAFDGVVKVKPVTKPTAPTDAHSHVAEGEDEDDFPS